MTPESPRDDVRSIEAEAAPTRFARGWHCLGLTKDFGDGTPPSSEQNPVHAYTTDQQYTVTLTVTDQDEQASVSKATFTIPLAAGGSSTP